MRMPMTLKATRRLDSVVSPEELRSALLPMRPSMAQLMETTTTRQPSKVLKH